MLFSHLRTLRHAPHHEFFEGGAWDTYSLTPAPSSAPPSGPQRLAESPQPRWSSFSGVQHRPRTGSYRERVEELEGLSVLASIPGLKLDRLPRYATTMSIPAPTITSRRGPSGSTDTPWNVSVISLTQPFCPRPRVPQLVRSCWSSSSSRSLCYYLSPPMTGSQLPSTTHFHFHQRGDRYGSDYRLHSPAVVDFPGRP